MQSSRGLHLHGATPSPPERSAPVPSSFHPSESVPPSSPYYINPLTDQRLTGSIMAYPQVDHHSISSAPAYQDAVSWPYHHWNASVMDAGPSSEDPPSVPMHTLGGMVAANHEGSAFVPPIPPSRMQSQNHYFGASTTQAPSFTASPPSRSPRDLQENALHFGASVGASAAPAASPHISQGAAPMQPFNSSGDIWHAVGSSPVTPTTGIASEKGGKGVQRRSPSESTRVNSRYDPVGTGRPPPRGMVRSGPASESLTDEGEEERDSDGSVRDVRDKKRRYAKTFRDTEKHLFEKLRHRLFPQDPHAKRSECLERAIESIDELMQLRESEAQRQKEMHYLKQQLSDAERRIERMYRELNGRSHPMGN
ncbi:hypothetical protein EI94DRAFT_1725322 [Lactarius quietus]|nr:hypothetical protein EI94DRAFT_1725322 [Lactarius quietus]